MTKERLPCLPEVLRNLQEDRNVKLSEAIVDRADALISSLNVHRAGGITFAGFRATLTWQNGENRTDLDMHMTCPACPGSCAEVYYSNQACGCAESSPSRLQLDKDDQGLYPRSEENMYMQTPAPGKSYTLRVRLFSGPPVEFKVVLHRKGQQDRVYKMKAHTASDEDKPVISVFTAGADESGSMTDDLVDSKNHPYSVINN
mmetsp:Transcript_19145/g.44576  ORF Transcript_19145/g.44576 Transcript_19145/m.44576 type:complete len:202 (+) Transcript_19145:304-909(+)